MSMIYECPTCHTPQGAGRTSCLSCGADFDGAVPDDALVPETPETEPVLAEAHDEASGVETIAAPVMESAAPPAAPEPAPHLEFVPPPASSPYEAPAYQAPAYQPPPTYAAPPSYPMNAQANAQANAQMSAPQSGIALPRGLLIALGVVLVLVLGVVFFTRNLDQSSGVVPAPFPSLPAATPVAPPTPVSSPVSLQGGAASSQSGSDMAKRLAGRWQAKSSDYYVFNDNGTGSRGSATGKLASDSFVWVMSQNQITLYLADKQEKLALSPGTDESTLFLRGEDGRYVQFVRTKANA